MLNELLALQFIYFHFPGATEQNAEQDIANIICHCHIHKRGIH